jgi:hypothetical protein
VFRGDRPAWPTTTARRRRRRDPALGRGARRQARDRQGTESGGEDAGILRIEFPGGEEDRLETISWDDWFEKLDEENLAFLCQEQVKSGDESRFFKLVNR